MIFFCYKTYSSALNILTAFVILSSGVDALLIAFSCSFFLKIYSIIIFCYFSIVFLILERRASAFRTYLSDDKVGISSYSSGSSYEYIPSASSFVVLINYALFPCILLI